MPSTVQLTDLVPRASVFVVEDNEQLSAALESVLVSNGYDVTSSLSGREALERLDAGPLPDVILLDIMMPGMTGWEFRLEQRSRGSAAEVPVVAMSANRSPEACAIDASAYLGKPFETQELLDTIERVMLRAERARLAAHSAEFERLRSMGLLAAGIVHEINNPLTFVAGNSELMRRAAVDLATVLSTRDAREALQRMLHGLDQLDQGVERIASVVRSVATFSHPNHEVTTVDVNEVLGASVRLVSNELRHRAELKLELLPVPVVRGNAAQLGQVFLNLLINAMHAVTEGDAGRNQVGVKTCVRSGRTPTSRGDEAEHVCIEISDTGCGIAPDVLPRIFEPFFTTKAVGQGMGLGLSISRGVVEGMGGSISVESVPGGGTTFRVALPICRGLAKSQGEAEEPAFQSGPPQYRHRLAIVDDEPMICEWLEQMLRDTCDVVVFASSREALGRIVGGETFDLILCDLMMPELTGMDLFDEVSARRTEMAGRLVFMTGGAFTEQAQSFVERMRPRTLRKPFHVHELFALIETYSVRGKLGYADA